jgi:hypothetical protein
MERRVGDGWGGQWEPWRLWSTRMPPKNSMMPSPMESAGVAIGSYYGSGDRAVRVIGLAELCITKWAPCVR